MESRIKICSPPENMKKQFSDSALNIRYYELIEKSTDTDDYVYEVILRHKEFARPLRSNPPYESWESLKRAMERKNLII